MGKALSTTIQNQIDNQAIKSEIVFTVGGIDYTSYLISRNINFNRQFGAATASFTIDNDSAIFSIAGTSEIKVGDFVSFIEKFEGDSTEWNSFYGKVEQRAIDKTVSSKTLTITCLDVLADLKLMDIDFESEGTKVEVTDETLSPNYLAEPNEELSQVFDFANDALAQNPRPILMITDQNGVIDNDIQNDGFEINYKEGQVRMGSPLNTLDNFNLKAVSYSYYVEGLNIEDLLETILSTTDGYGNFLFGETSAANVVTNHLRADYCTEEGTLTDTLIPNLTTETITIKTDLTANVAANDTSISVTSTEGFPTAGSGTLNGDAFTWTGKTATTLTGIPSSGANALKAHNSGDLVKYETTYAAGRVWYMKYNNITTDLTSGNFSIPSGSTIDYVDEKFGRVLLDAAIATTSVLTCDVNYTFKTLQSTGIQVNYIRLHPRQYANRLDAIKALLEYVSPNYSLRTQGDTKIWASYLAQRTVADYTLSLVKRFNYMEDDDLFTRVNLYAKNANPTNIVFKDGVDFVSTGESFKGTASNVALSYDSSDDEYHLYTSSITGAGYINVESILPEVYINNIPINNTVQQLVQQQVEIEVLTKTEVKTGCHGVSSEQYTKVHTNYIYSIRLPHTNIQPTESIVFYDNTGLEKLTISPNDIHMDYARGVYHVPAHGKNADIEQISTATFYVFYSTDDIIIDYDNVAFYISKRLIPNVTEAAVTATFEYWTIMMNIFDIASIIDGRFDTQVQTEFFAEPTTGFNYAILDLGATYSIQAIDLVAGFYKPDNDRRFDIDMRLTIEGSTDGVTYSVISDSAANFSMSGGESVSFEEEDLGISFQARYLKLVLDKVEKIDFGGGVYVVAFTELSVFGDIVLKSESTLISTTKVNGALSGGEGTVVVDDTTGFDSSGTIYISETAVTYTGVTSTSFTGCSGVVAADDNTRVSQTLDTDTTLYDDDGILPNLGDRLYKDIKITDDRLYTQAELDKLSKDFLKEYYKEHSKINVSAMYAPYLKIGQTVSVTDAYNNLVAERYFVEQISSRNGNYNIILAKYPADN